MRFRQTLFLLLFSLLSLLSFALAQSVYAEVTNGPSGSGCGADTNSAWCNGPAVVTYTCDGRKNECRLNEGAWGTSASTAGLACGKTMQIDVFDKKCRIGDAGWDQTCQNTGFVVWYSGDCPAGEEPPPPSGSSQCSDTAIRLKLPEMDKFQSPKQIRDSGISIYPNTIVQYKVIGNDRNRLQLGWFSINHDHKILKQVVRPDNSVWQTAKNNNKQAPINVKLGQSGRYTFKGVPASVAPDYWCPSSGWIEVLDQPITVCGGNCGEGGNLCPDGNICNQDTGTCQLETCYANPALCDSSMCALLPNVDCAEPCGPETGLCTDGHTCQEGVCVLNACLSSDVNCTTDRCDILPDVQCGDSCGPDTGVCPEDNTCSNGTCVANTCLDNPNRCESDMCTINPLLMQCIDINPEFSSFKIGGNYEFTCTPVEQAKRYEFRALYTTSKEGRSDAEITSIEPTSSGSNRSEAFNVDKVGRYIFQCRPCLDNDVCTEWGISTPVEVEPGTEQSPVPAVSPSPSPAPSPTPTEQNASLTDQPSPTENLTDEMNGDGETTENEGDDALAPGETPSDDKPELNNNDGGSSAAYVENGCMVTGCSGTICQDADMEPIASTCDFKPEYACYGDYGRCEKQDDGKCDWTESSELSACLASPTYDRSSTDLLNQSNERDRLFALKVDGRWLNNLLTGLAIR